MTHDDGRNHGELRTRRVRRVHRCGATLTIVAVAVALTSCSSAPTPTAPVTSKPVATTAATTAPTETTAPTVDEGIARNIELNKSSPIEDFRNRPQDEQLAYVQNMLDFEITDAPASETLARSPIPYGDSRKMEEWNPAIPGVMSRQNNGQEIVNMNSFLESFASAQPVDPNAQSTSKADITQERKLLAGVYYYADAAKDPTGGYAVSDKTITSSDTTQVLTGPDKMRVDSYTTMQKGLDRYQQPIEFVDCTVNSDGNTEIQTYVFKTFKGKDGQDHSLWLLAGVKKL